MLMSYEEYVMANEIYTYQETYDFCRAESYIEKENLDFVLGIKYQEEEE